MTTDPTIRIDDLPKKFRELFRPRENDRVPLGTSRSVQETFPQRFTQSPLATRTELQTRKLQKLTELSAQLERTRARPLRYILTDAYKGRSGLALINLPLKAINGMTPALEDRLLKCNINTISELANASLKELQAASIPIKDVALARASAIHIIKHATTPNIQESLLPLAEILKPKYVKLPPKDLLNQGLEALKEIDSGTAKKISSAGNVKKIGDLRGVSQDTLIAAGASPREASLFTDLWATINEHLGLSPLTNNVLPTLGILRVLKFDGVLHLPQGITPEYSLDNPNIRREPDDITNEPYVGYLIAADEIVICEDIKTKGNDLVLVAKTIRAGRTTAISIDTRPDDFTEAAQEGRSGQDGENGGDLVFLCQHYTVLPDSVFLTSGRNGQGGGSGHAVTKRDFLTEGKDFEVPQPGGTLDGVLWGINVPTRCSFHIVSLEADPGARLTYRSYEDYHKADFWGSPVDVVGDWTLYSNFLTGFGRYDRVTINIPDACYPTNGRAGGYGGNPGKISLIMPSFKRKPKDLDKVVIVAKSGGDGAPGHGGKGGDCTPGELRVEGSRNPLSVYWAGHLSSQTKTTFRGRPNEVVAGWTDKFNALRGDRLDGLPIKDKLEDAICGVSFGADILVSYAPSVTCKRSQILKEAYMLGGRPWPASIWLGAIRHSEYNSMVEVEIPNILTPNIESMGLILENGQEGEPKRILPTETEELAMHSMNWYQTVYELIPSYPLGQYAQADDAYRRGNFKLAAELYAVVLSFAKEVLAFEESQSAVIGDAKYRMSMVSAGYDYFGFKADSVIPVCPIIGDPPNDLTEAYTETVRFYRDDIRGKQNTIDSSEAAKSVIQAFLSDHEIMIQDIQHTLVSLYTDMAVLNSESDAIEKEINALHWANQRLSGLLQRWAERVEQKINELKALEETAEAPGWWDLIKTIVKTAWAAFTFVTSIFEFGVGLAQAVVASVNALSTLGDLKDKLLGVSVMAENLVSHLGEWSSWQINGAIDNMVEVTKQIETCHKSVDDAWKNATTKLQDIKNSFAEIQSNLQELTAGDMTAEEMIDFQDNLLLADTIGVSGGMDYLQIQEQIYLNHDILYAKYSSLQALTLKRAGLAQQAVMQARGLAAHQAESQYLNEMLAMNSWTEQQNQTVLERLTKLGQHSLDALMRQLAELTHQLKFLNLDKTPIQGDYAHYIDLDGGVEDVLQIKSQLIDDIHQWILKNNNIRLLKVVVTDDPQYAGNPGGIVIIDRERLENFTRGKYLRPSRILEIEPLRETTLVAHLAEEIRIRRSDPGELGRFLVSQFLIEDEGVKVIIDPRVVGFGSSPEVVDKILKRERMQHPLLDSLAGELLDDATVVMAYSLARGGVSVEQLTSVLEQDPSPIPDLLQTKLETLKSDWASLSSDILNEDVKSLRSIVETLKSALGNPAEMRTVLDEALIVIGQFVWLGRFHLELQDIQDEIANSWNPVLQNQILSSIYYENPDNIITALILLYAGLDGDMLQSLIAQYTINPNPLGECINHHLRPRWNDLRKSVLEKRHDIIIEIKAEDYTGIPNAFETFREVRFLAAMAKISTGIALRLEKLPPDLYIRQQMTGANETIEFTFKNSDDMVGNTVLTLPPALNLDDFQGSDLFARSILGKWALSFTYQGDRPALPSLTLLEVEFMHTYMESD